VWYCWRVAKTKTEAARTRATLTDDNARKFVTVPFSSKFLERQNAIEFSLKTDWLFGESACEIKTVCRKQFNTPARYHLITKFSNGANRLSHKLELGKDTYCRLIKSSCARLEKERWEFTLLQNGVLFSLKYDKFDVGDCYVLEVDAANGEQHARRAFRPDLFPYKLKEVSGDLKYYGIRMAETVGLENKPAQEKSEAALCD
jgi:hypothetical protein